MKFAVSIYLVITVLFLIGCESTTNQVVKFNNLTATGDFLFEGPNTLQGSFSVSNEDIAQELSISKEKILSVKLESINVQLPSDSAYKNIESLLVQVVNDAAPLVTLGTISPLTASQNQILSINKDINIAPYLHAKNSTLVVDTNLKSDVDDLSVTVAIGLSVNHKQ